MSYPCKHNDVIFVPSRLSYVTIITDIRSTERREGSQNIFQHSVSRCCSTHWGRATDKGLPQVQAVIFNFREGNEYDSADSLIAAVVSTLVTIMTHNGTNVTFRIRYTCIRVICLFQAVINSAGDLNLKEPQLVVL